MRSRNSTARPVVPRPAILLRDGPVTVGISPDHGGALSRFDILVGDQLFNLLRPARYPYALHPHSLGFSSFPLVPYCGRLREGRFKFDGRRYQFPLNAKPERHSSHGDGWTRPWVLNQLSRAMAVMTLEPDDALPIRYRCTQRIAVTGSHVQVILNVRNEDLYRIPVGIGLHPYFANRDLATITGNFPIRWRWDHEMMPLFSETNPLAAKFRSGYHGAGLPIAAEYSEWDGKASIEWQAMKIRINLETTPRLKHVVMWAPEGEGFFCLEPVSHATDALHRQDGHPPYEDFVILNPQDTYEQRFDFFVFAL